MPNKTKNIPAQNDISYATKTAVISTTNARKHAIFIKVVGAHGYRLD